MHRSRYCAQAYVHVNNLFLKKKNISQFNLIWQIEFVLAVESAKKKKLVEGSEHSGEVLLEKPDYFIVVLKESSYR